MRNSTKWLVVSAISLLLYVIVTHCMMGVRGNASVGGEGVFIVLSGISFLMAFVGGPDD